jgi:hypothetical protein
MPIKPSPTVAAVTLALAALAAPSAADANPEWREPGGPRNRAGLQLMLLPAGSIELEGLGLAGSTDTAVAYGISLHVEGALGQFLTLGLAPQMIFNVQDDDSGEATEELDLMARIAAWYPTAGRLAPYAYLAPGYSIIFPFTEDGESAKGFVIGFGAGAHFSLSSRMYATAEVGFQLGFQGTEIAGQDVNFETEYLHLSLGAGSRF